VYASRRIFALDGQAGRIQARMNVLLKYPTRGRPELFRSTLAKYRGTAETAIAIVVSIDSDDTKMNRPDIIAGLKAEGIAVGINKSQGKIAAINADIPADGWDILVLASDDHLPVCKGWDTRILSDMPKDGSPCMLWYKDIRQDRINLMPIMNRAAYDLFGYIYHPSYVSLWCDNEQTEVGQAMGILKQVDIELFRNESPDWGGTVKRDKLYQRNNLLFKIDQQNYMKRKAKGFPA